MNKKKQIHKCDYCCNNKATHKIYEDYIDSYIYLCEDCYEKMNEDVNPSTFEFLSDDI